MPYYYCLGIQNIHTHIKHKDRIVNTHTQTKREKENVKADDDNNYWCAFCS